MREDYLESLDKMFPKGWGMIYTAQDDQVRWADYNPNNIEQIFRFRDLAKDIKDEHC